VQRARPDDGNDDDDDISLVSRSPSPTEAMEVDSHGGIYAYHSSYVAPEVVTVETKIKPTNKGFALLSKLGWAEGQPIGLSGEGASWIVNDTSRITDVKQADSILSRSTSRRIPQDWAN